MTSQVFQCEIDEGQVYDDDCCDDGLHGYGCSKITAVPDGSINGDTSRALLDALSSELKQMVQGQVTHSSLNQISRFANIAQELIMVRSPIADVRQRKRRPIIGGYGQGAISNSPAIGGTGYPLEENALTGEAALNETFGAKLVRELIPALSASVNKGSGEKGVFEDLVDAIAAAKKGGLDEVAEGLEAKLSAIIKIKPESETPALDQPEETSP